jgi:ribokinase
VTPVDTTGAGDAFCGALAHGLATGSSLMDAVTMAVKVAGHSTRFFGAQPPTPPYNTFAA